MFTTRTAPPRPLTRALTAGAALLCLGTAHGDVARHAWPPPAPRIAPPANALLVEDFSAGLDRWTSDREGVWTVRRGMLRADLPDRKQERSFLYAGDSAWTDVAVELDMCMMRGVDKGVAVRVDGDNGVGVDLRGPGYQDVLLHRREWPLGRAPAPNANGVWHRLRVEARGTTFRVFVNGELKLERANARSAPRRGRIALPAYTGGAGECTVWYDNVVVTPIAPVPDAR
uniref:DUF1080 domain-containing protein n=1 Tax=Eiseniibacteriota bacterium TaxID=2212470 RepID=A0A832I0Y1_UNCEI